MTEASHSNHMVPFKAVDTVGFKTLMHLLYDILAADYNLKLNLFICLGMFKSGSVRI